MVGVSVGVGLASVPVLGGGSGGGSSPLTISNLAPADNTTDVAVDVLLVVTFSQNITFGTGNITLQEVV